MMLRLIERPNDLVLSLEEARQHLRRLDTHEDDSSIALYNRAAQSWAENFTGRSFIDTTWDLYLDAFPNASTLAGRSIRIPKGNLLEIVGVFANGVEFTGYFIDYSMPSIYLSVTGSWPTVDGSPNSVRIRFRSGYIDLTGSPGPDGKVPHDIKAAIAIYMATLYENREISGEAVKSPLAEELLRMYRIEDSMA